MEQWNIGQDSLYIGHEFQVICHSGLDPESSLFWIPAFAGMTPFISTHYSILPIFQHSVL